MEFDWTSLIIGLASIITTVFLIPFLREKYKQVKTETLDYWLRVLMSSAETYFATGEGKQKKQWVLDQLQEKFPKLDIGLIDHSLEAMFRELVVEGILNNGEFK